MSKVIVVLPTFNEAENLPRMVEALLALSITNMRILVIDDNSPDGTGKIADKLAASNPKQISVMHRARKMGLGTAYIAGFNWALSSAADYILQMDCDFSHQPSYIPAMIAAAEHNDLVIGSRYAPGGTVDDSWSWFREKLSWFANSVYVSMLLNMPIHDATGGFRVWRRETLLGMDFEHIRSTGYVSTVEMAYMAYQLGYQITEIPIHFPDRTQGKSKMSFKIQLEAAYRVWQIRRLHHALTPDMRLTETDTTLRNRQRAVMPN